MRSFGNFLLQGGRDDLEYVALMVQKAEKRTVRQSPSWPGVGSGVECISAWGQLHLLFWGQSPPGNASAGFTKGIPGSDQPLPLGMVASGSGSDSICVWIEARS